MQEIIVYRNPLEAAMWQMLQNGQMFPIIVGCIAAVFGVIAAAWVTNKIWGSFRAPKWIGNVQLLVGAATGVFTAWYFWI